MASDNNIDAAQAAFTIDNGTFHQKTLFIRSELNHNKVVDLTSNPSNYINIWDFHGGINQQWQFLYDSSSMSYQIISADTGMAMASYTNGKMDMIRPTSSSAYDWSGYWQLRKITNTNFYILKNIGSSMVLELTNSNLTNGTALRTYYETGNAGQYWVLEVKG